MTRSLFVLVLLLFANPADAQCTLSGEATIERVRVAPRAGAPFEIGLDGHEVSLRPLGRGRVAVESTSALAWAGTARSRAVRVFLAAPFEIAAGAATLRPSATLTRLRLDPGAAPRVLVELASGVRIRGVEVPCDALALQPRGDGNPPSDTTGVPPEAANATLTAELVHRSRRRWTLPRERRLRFYSRPGGASVVLEFAFPEALHFREMERRGGFIRLRRELRAAVLDGWVRASEVRRVATAQPGEWSVGRLPNPCARATSDAHVGPATLAVGTELRVAPGGAVWAVASGDIDVRIAIESDAEWGRVEEIPGLVGLGECGGYLEAWAPVGALIRPASAP